MNTIVKQAGSDVILTKVTGDSFTLPAKYLRQKCSGAGNKNPENVKDDVVATSIQHRGNYAVSISWDDGHNSIYPYDQIEQLATQYLSQK